MEKLEIQGDNPKPRFGHTMNLISKNKSILFAGAIGDSSQYSITNDVFSLDLLSLKWKKLNPHGKKPSVRAAHAACSIELYQILIFGGATGGGGLSSDDLFLLDLKNGEDNAQWVPLTISGKTPGKRYGHSLIFSKPSIYVFGGNSGSMSLNDVWSMDLDKSPFIWYQMDLSESPELPIARVYHSAALCTKGAANGMMVIFGGRGNDSNALNDAWGLRKHRDGKWDWVKAPIKNSEIITPKARYQHSIIFSGTLLIVVGGKTNVVGENLPLEVYDTDTSKWDRFLDIPKFRNSVIPYESGLLMYGGFEPENPNIPTNKFLFINFTQIFENFEYLLKNSDFSNISTSKDIIQTSNTQNSTFIGQVLSERIPSPNKKQIRLGLLAVIATIPGPYDNLKDIMKKIPIQNLQEESKKMHPNNSPKKTFTDFKLSYKEELAYYFLNMLKEPKIANIKFVNPAKDMLINLLDEIQKIFQSEPTLLELRSPLKIFGNLNGQYEDLFKIFEHFGYPNESFGDIEGIDYLFLGDYVDRGNKSLELICFLFALKLKYPEQINLLRGHHEDKIVNSVLGFEEECAEKLVEDTKNPNSIFQRINRVFEYMPLAAVIENKLLCVHGGIGQNVKKLEDIAKITKPIEILHDFTDLKSTPEQIIVNELLWTDPVSNNEEDDKINKRGFFGNEEIRCRKFSLERTKDFLDLNKLSMIIRSHEFIKDGYQNFNQKIITIVSCLDYCGELKNAGGIIYIRKNFVISPKIIIPERIVGQKEKKWFVIKEKSSGTQENNKIRQFVSPLRR